MLVIAPPVKIAPGFDPLADSHLPVSGFFTYPPAFSPTVTFSALPFVELFPPVTSGVFLTFNSVTVLPFALSFFPLFKLSAPFWNPSNAFLLVIAPPVKDDFSSFVKSSFNKEKPEDNNGYSNIGLDLPLVDYEQSDIESDFGDDFSSFVKSSFNKEKYEDNMNDYSNNGLDLPPVDYEQKKN